jgi:hypothetical protein
MLGRHVAYGLDLHASFPLIGMRTGDGRGLPSLALELLTPDELEDRWSGREGPPEWIGRLGDGCTLTVERGVCGDMLFTYGDRARFRLDASRERLECVPLCAGLHWQQTLLGRVLPDVALLRGYEALHACAVDSPEGVVAVAGPSGMGKTTLALELMGRGWPLVADDVLTLGDGPEGVVGYPGSPHVNVAESSPGAAASEQLGATLGRLAGERWIAVHTAAERPRPVRMICLLERGPDCTLESRLLPSNPLPLVPYMLGLADGVERARHRFTYYGDLVDTATLLALTCASADPPRAVADLIEQALTRERTLSVGGAG